MRKLVLFCISVVFVMNAFSQWQQSGTNVVGQSSVFLVDGNKLYSGSGMGGGLYVSEDNGVNWTKLGGSAISTTYALAVKGSKIYLGNEYGVYISTDNGQTFTASNTGLSSTYYTVTALLVDGSTIFAGTTNGLYVSTDDGALWTITSLSKYVRSMMKVGTDIYAGTYSDGVYISSDNGSTWTQVVNGMSKTTTYSPIFSMANIDNTIFAALKGTGVYKSTDKGATWTLANGTMTKDIWGIAVSGTNLFAGGDYVGVYLSTDKGTTWTAVNTGLPETYTLMPTVYTLVVANQTLFAQSSYVWKRPLSEMITVQNTPVVETVLPRVSISPNPASKTITINDESISSISIFNTSGQLLLEKKINDGEEVSIESIPPGLYMVKLQGTTSVSDVKLLVQ